jgi:putative transcriptional regulator
MTSARALKANAKPRAKSRMRREIVEAMRGLRKVGTVSDGGLEKTALCMLGRDALPKVEAMSRLTTK